MSCKENEPIKCAKEESPNSLTKELVIYPKNILLDYFLTEMQPQLNSMTDDYLYSGTGLCSTSRLVEVINSFDCASNINNLDLEDHEILHFIATSQPAT